MIRKLLRVAGVLGVMGVSACAAPAEEVEPEAVPIGQVKQAYCFGGPGTVPFPDRVVAGFDNPVTSGPYGHGACDGYAVKITSLGGPNVTVVGHVGDAPSEAACNSTKVTLWVWTRPAGGAWRYRGMDIDDAFWFAPAGVCLHAATVSLDSAFPNDEVTAKVQARTEGTGYGFTYNRPIRVHAQ